MDEFSPLLAAAFETFNPERQHDVAGPDLQDVIYHHGVRHTRGTDGVVVAYTDLPVVHIAFNRPELCNAFRSEAVDSLYRALDCARLDPSVGAVVLTDNGPSPKDDGWVFCPGSDQRVYRRNGYRYEGVAGDEARFDTEIPPAGHALDGRLSGGRPPSGGLYILEAQRLIQNVPKVVIAAVSGWATDGGHSLHVVCDLSAASFKYARSKQTDANVGSFGAEYGSQLFARQVGDRRAREIFSLARLYSAGDVVTWGAVNEAVSHVELGDYVFEYAVIMVRESPQTVRMPKLTLNAADDGIAGMQAFTSETTRLVYMTEEAREGCDTSLERHSPDRPPFPHYA